MINKRYW